MFSEKKQQHTTTYIQLFLQISQNLCYSIGVLRVMFFLGLVTHESHGKQRWLQRTKR